MDHDKLKEVVSILMHVTVRRKQENVTCVDRRNKNLQLKSRQIQFKRATLHSFCKFSEYPTFLPKVKFEIKRSFTFSPFARTVRSQSTKRAISLATFDFTRAKISFQKRFNICEKNIENITFVKFYLAFLWVIYRGLN